MAQPAISAEVLLEQVRELTKNQEELIQTIRILKDKANDPFLNFTTPDPIRNIPNFNGNRKEVLAWVQDAEQTLALFDQYKGDICYGQIIRSIKNKITGEAREILIASGNPTTWEEIKEVLINAYGDRRDLTSHIQSLFYIRQGKKTLPEYYNKIRTIDTAIKSSAAGMDDYKSHTKVINSFVSLITLTRFVDGLNEDISMHVRSCRPETLEHAYEITQQYSNAAYRHKLDRKVNNPTPSFPKQLTGEQSKIKPNNFNNNSRYSDRTPSGKFKNKVQTDDDASMRTHVSKMQVNNHTQQGKETVPDTEYEPEYDPPNETTENPRLESDDDDYLFSDEINFHLTQGKNPKT